MKITTLQEDLEKAISIVSRFISSRVQLPILSHVLLTVQNGKLQISATNLEVGIHVWIGAQISQNGKTTLSARTFQEVITTLRPGKIDIEEVEGILCLTSDGTTVRIPTTPPNDFPTIIESIPKKHSLIPTWVFQAINSQVAFASAQEETKPAYTGILFLPKSEGFEVVATDGVRLSKKTIDTKVGVGQSVLVPTRVITELPKISSHTDKKSNIQLAVQTEENQVVFSWDSMVLVSRLIDAKFPDFEKIIPTSWVTRVTVDKDEFAQTLQRASVFAEDYKIELNIEKGKLTVVSANPQYGSQTSLIAVKNEGENMNIAFNCRFLKDALGAITGDNLVMELTGPASPGIFRDPKDDTFLHLIMPIRINQG